MSKVVKAINVMISNHQLIDHVVFSNYGDEIFFTYDDKHRWSIIRIQGEVVSLNYYPGDYSVHDLAQMPEDFWSGYNDYISYNSSDLGGREARDSLNELYRVVSEKRFGMDKVLDDIIDSEIPF